MSLSGKCQPCVCVPTSMQNLYLVTKYHMELGLQYDIKRLGYSYIQICIYLALRSLPRSSSTLARMAADTFSLSPMLDT